MKGWSCSKKEKETTNNKQGAIFIIFARKIKKRGSQDLRSSWNQKSTTGSTPTAGNQQYGCLHEKFED